MSSGYRQCRQPGDRLKDHQHTEHPRKPRHEPEGYERNPTECVKSVGTNRYCTEERRHQGVSGK